MLPDDHLPRPVKHGTVNAYQKRRCRCDLCRVAWRDYHREGGYDKRYKDKKRREREAQRQAGGAS